MTLISLRERLHLIGEPGVNSVIRAIPSGFYSAPNSLRAMMDAMRPPRIGEWVEHTPRKEFDADEWREECGGIANDGTNWYISTNLEGFSGVYKLDEGFRFMSKAAVPDNLHVGDLDVSGGKVYVAIDAGPKVAVFNLDLALEGVYTLGPGGVDGGIAWCAIHPWNGYLYTSSFNGVTKLHAYDPRDSFQYRGELRLQSAPFGGVQAGCISSNGHIYLVSDKFPKAYPVNPNGNLMVFSALNGALLGAIPLPNDHSWTEQEEVEGLTIARAFRDGTRVDFHVLLLDNDVSVDDAFIVQYRVPDPEVL